MWPQIAPSVTEVANVTACSPVDDALYAGTRTTVSPEIKSDQKLVQPLQLSHVVICCHMLSYVVTLISMLEEYQTSEKGRCWSTLWTRNLNELEWTLVNIWVNQKEAWHRRHGLFPLPSWCPRCWCRCIAMQQFSRLEPSRPSRPLAQLVNRRMETIRGLFSNFWHLGHLGLVLNYIELWIIMTCWTSVEAVQEDSGDAIDACWISFPGKLWFQQEQRGDAVAPTLGNV